MQDHRQNKLYVFKPSIGSGRTNESNEIYERKIVLQDRVWRRQSLNTKSVWRLPEADVIRESEEP